MSDEEFLLAVRGAYSYIEAQSDLDKYKAQIRAEVIDELAHELKETFNCQLPSNYSSTQPFFTLDNVRALVNIVVREHKGE